MPVEDSGQGTSIGRGHSPNITLDKRLFIEYAGKDGIITPDYRDEIIAALQHDLDSEREMKDQLIQA